jgi:transcriptional regulator with XRE-family HTH domain
MTLSPGLMIELHGRTYSTHVYLCQALGKPITVLLMTSAEMMTLGEAIRSAREAAGLSQKQLGVKLGQAIGRDPFSQGTISTWEHTSADKDGPPAERVFLIEQVLDRPAGSISRHGGFIPIGSAPVVTVEEAVANDLRLDTTGKEAVMAVYRVYVPTETS